MKPSATCHPEREHYAHGLCSHCYKVRLYKVNPAAREKNRRTSREWWEKNRVKVLEGQRKRYAENREFERERAYGYRLKRKYGISLAEYLAMLEKQNRSCAICGAKQQKNVRLALDHCHATGKNRALLCSRCNLTLGAVNDNPKLLERLAAYLRQH